MTGPRVLHIFPDSVVDPSQRHLGSTKDIRGRTQYFRDRGLPYEELIHERSAESMAAAVDQVDLTPFGAVIVEFPLSGRAVRAIRERNPQAVLLTRSATAELLHRRDWARAMGPSVASAKVVIRGVLNAVSEVAAGRNSTAMLAISDWEARHYWPRLVRQHKIHWLPTISRTTTNRSSWPGTPRNNESACV